METIKSNNTSRIGLIFNKLIIEQHKTLLFLAGGYLGICIVIGLWAGIMEITPSDATLVFYMILAGLVCSIVASKTCFELVKKEERLAFLMTPASMSDKFLTRVILEIPAMLVLTFLGYLLMCAVMILANGMMYHIWAPYSGTFAFFRNINCLYSILAILGMYLFTEGWFILGSVLWPKKSFLKSVVIMTLIQVAMSLGLVLLTESNLLWKYSIVIVDENATVWITFIITALISIAMIYGAYFKLKRIKVIS